MCGKRGKGAERERKSKQKKVHVWARERQRCGNREDRKEGREGGERE
jgi:hypothetical protein